MKAVPLVVLLIQLTAYQILLLQDNTSLHSILRVRAQPGSHPEVPACVTTTEIPQGAWAPVTRSHRVPDRWAILCATCGNRCRGRHQEVTLGVCVCVYVCVRERERECMCAYVCVWERERVHLCVRVCMCETKLSISHPVRPFLPTKSQLLMLFFVQQFAVKHGIRCVPVKLDIFWLSYMWNVYFSIPLGSLFMVGIRIWFLFGHRQNQQTHLILCGVKVCNCVRTCVNCQRSATRNLFC